MNPTLLIFGIQATLRAAQARADLYAEQARDRKVFLPHLELPEGSRSVQLLQFLIDNPQLADSHRELADIWDATHQELTTTKPERIDAAYAAMLEHAAERQLTANGRDQTDVAYEAKMLAAGRMIEQWREERQPPSAIIRMALTLTDIGLEFVSSNPSILGVGSRGEKLITAFAGNMSKLLPDDVAAFGPRSDFADRVLGIFLRSGLASLTDNASTLFRDKDVAKLLTGVTKPIVDALPDSIAQQIHYRNLVDALAGPSADAAFRLLAENTGIYWGKAFADDRALGAVTSALFSEIQNRDHDGSIVDVFSEQGVIGLYQAALKVAVERPALFTGDDRSAKSELIRKLLSGSAAILRTNPRLKGPVGASLAALAIEVVGNHAPAIMRFNPDEPWEKVAVAVTDQLNAGLSDALNTMDEHQSVKGALNAFSDGQLLELGRIVLVQVARTPGMLGAERSEVQSIIGGMAKAMAADDNLLLSSEQWLSIAGAAARVAAANPGRLFGLSVDDQDDAVAVNVINSILAVANNSWTDAGRDARPLLFGETLEAVVAAAVESLAGNITAVTNTPGIVGGFLHSLLEMASARPENFGSATILRVFRAFIGAVLADGRPLVDHDIDDILST